MHPAGVSCTRSTNTHAHEPPRTAYGLCGVCGWGTWGLRLSALFGLPRLSCSAPQLWNCACQPLLAHDHTQDIEHPYVPISRICFVWSHERTPGYSFEVVVVVTWACLLEGAKPSCLKSFSKRYLGGTQGAAVVRRAGADMCMAQDSICTWVSFSCEMFPVVLGAT